LIADRNLMSSHLLRESLERDPRLKVVAVSEPGDAILLEMEDRDAVIASFRNQPQDPIQWVLHHSLRLEVMAIVERIHRKLLWFLRYLVAD
jgi:hypothetical protein